MSLSFIKLDRMEIASPTATGTGGDAHKTKEVAPFLKSLRRMLDVESDKILRWTSNGRAFEILDLDQMMHVVLPKYFKHQKYTSFQRQLNYFNFKKWTKSKAVVCTFSNDFFVRDQPELAWRIARKKSAQSGLKSPTARRPIHASQSPPLPTMTMKHIEVASYGGGGAYQKAADEMAIMVPRSKLGKCSEPYPSPTDMDMMLAHHDVEAAHRYYHHPHVPTAVSYTNSYTTASYSSNNNHHHHHLLLHNNSIGGHTAGHEADSFEWIDSFLPSLESHPKSDDPGFLHAMGHQQQQQHYPYHQQAYSRAAHYAYPAAPTDYVSTVSM